MVPLPCFLLFSFLWVGALPDEPALKICPGICVQGDNSCNEAVINTNCGESLICCLDGKKSTTNYLQSTEIYSTISSSDIKDDEAVESVKNNRLSGVDQEFRVASELRYEAEEIVEKHCPGACVPSHYGKFCDYILSLDTCREGLTCCVTEKDAMRLQRRAGFSVPSPFSRGISHATDAGKLTCPGTCVHPSNVMFCDKILPEYPCPINAKCCNAIQSHDKVIPSSSIQKCEGKCYPYHLHGYCFLPNELVMSKTCSPGTTCCMRPQTPDIHRISFPAVPSIERFSNSDKNSPKGTVLGYLASDDEGNIFKVSPDGQISPLPILTPQDRLNTFVNVAKFDRADGIVFIFSDTNGFLFQKFTPHPHRAPPKPFNGEQLPTPNKDFVQLASAYQQQGAKLPPLASDPLTKTHFGTNPTGSPILSTASSTDKIVVIPDDNDKVPMPSTTTSPLVKMKHSRPPCPGSCMSYFLRFTCFRGYATYDGFSCSGRSVCCAKLKDIEDHEQFLKSLSPYFKDPPSSRDPVLPRCGIKGRRDTPRVMGGQDSIAGKWCWQVAVINMENQYICGGALIDNSWVLTAAHCVAGPITENQVLYIRAGVTDLKSPEDNAAGQTVRVLSIFMHHNFNSINLDNDIALLRLQKPIELVTNVCVICLPTGGHMPREDTKCTVTGYGFVSNAGTMSLKIREAQVPLVDDIDCMSNVTEVITSPFILPASSFCAGGHGQQDACQGDAGGPLACEVGGYYELVGLVSWSLGCGRSDVPSIYVKVPSFMGWINQIISSSSFLTSLN